MLKKLVEHEPMTGQERAAPNYMLRAGRFDLEIALDRKAESICVLHIYRARRIP